MENINLEKNNRKKRGWKFWIIFWSVSTLLLFSWAIFWQYQNKGIAGFLGFAKPLIKSLPMKEKTQEELFAALDIYNKITQSEKEQTFLILFQNNMEIRPGGGFIGAFGIMKVQGDKITHIDVHDTGVFDGRTESNVVPPFPMGRLLNIKNWEMRDSNWYPDFPANAEKIEYFYHLEGGEEEPDGIVAVSTELLPSFLEITGPITIDGYPGEYNSENAIMKLEYQVEKGFYEQGIDVGQRKYVMKDLASEILRRVADLSWTEKREFLKIIEKHLDEKDVMIYFKDDQLQDKIRSLGWSGEIKNVESDYLMMVDANLGAYKTDYYIKRSFEYKIDLSGEKPRVDLGILYENTAQSKDWMTTDYLTYLRVYVPEEAWFLEDNSGLERVFGKEFGKKYIGVVLKVPVGTQKEVAFSYELPAEMAENYSLLIQKQSGTMNTKGLVKIVGKDGNIKKQEIELDQDKYFE